MIDDYDGISVVGPEGERIGTVERSYVDDTGTARFLEVKLPGLRAKHRLVPADDSEHKDDVLTVPFGKDVVEGSPDASHAGDTLIGTILDDARAYYQSQRTTVADETVPDMSRDGDPASEVRTAAIPVNDSQTDTSASGDEEGIGGKIRTAINRVREKLPGTGGEAQSQDKHEHGDLGEIRDLGDVIEVPIVEEQLVKKPVVTEVLRVRKHSETEQQTVGTELRKEEVEVAKEDDRNG